MPNHLLRQTNNSSAVSVVGANWSSLCDQKAPKGPFGQESATTSLQVEKTTENTCQYISESDNLRVCHIDPLSNGVCLHSEILNPVSWLEIQFLLMGDNLKVLTKKKGELMMFEETGDRLCYD